MGFRDSIALFLLSDVDAFLRRSVISLSPLAPKMSSAAILDQNLTRDENFAAAVALRSAVRVRDSLSCPGILVRFSPREEASPLVQRFPGIRRRLRESIAALLPLSAIHSVGRSWLAPGRR